jgi:hypothetical protein
VVKVNGCSVPMGGILGFVNPGMAHDITRKKPTTRLAKNRK